MRMNWKQFANFSRFTGGAYGPIGLDIGSRWVKAVQLAGRGESRSLHAAAVLPTPVVPSVKDPVAEAEMLQTIAARLSSQLVRQGFHGRDVVVAAPAHRLEADLLELPPRGSGAPLDDLARVEI